MRPGERIQEEHRDVATIRRILFWTLIIGMAGTEAELLLLGHFENVWQLVPVVLLAVGIIAGLWHAITPGAATVRTIEALMVLFVISGGLGMLMHYQGNTEFELEMYPSLAGFELVKETMTGATPVLAPGTMALLGLVGLAHTYKLRTPNAE